MSNTRLQRQIISYHCNDKALLQICSPRKAHIFLRAPYGASGLEVQQFIRGEDNRLQSLAHFLPEKSLPIIFLEWAFHVPGKKGDVEEDKSMLLFLCVWERSD